ncbi:helix-turn-helix domain-containing protein [Herpetosiphon giganteus]|uniref:helix-turn-helix domain-containing protein n=1 Tax=Herpetosiphon giganteus TaxID=2029754 RepID=UPI001958358D|nr:helix-turn-helix domain-containing protein [Herpetosiphon giganteus]MBM7842184.1 putative site-specific integrase-resolvase [Herpetosiphon giganteus]
MLINRLKPYSLESLSGYMERLRRVNYYEERLWYLDFFPSSLREPLDHLKQPKNYEILSELTGLSPIQIYRMTVHRFCEMYNPRHFEQRIVDRERSFWNQGGLNAFIHGSNTWKICPWCWAKHQTLFIPWSARPVTTCFTHEVLLVDTCSTCREPLQINLVEGKCKSCATPLGELPVISIREHKNSLQLQHVVWGALGFAPSYPVGELAEDHPFLIAPQSHIIQFLWRGYNLMHIYDRHSPLLNQSQLLTGTHWEFPPQNIRTASIAEVHGALTAMCQLLYGWPQSWYDLLERILNADDSRISNSFPAVLMKRFRGDDWIWLRKSWADFVSQNMYDNPAMVPWLRYYRAIQHETSTYNPPLLSQKEAAKMLGVAELRLKKFVEQGMLVATAKPEKPERYIWQLIDAGSVEKLRIERSQYFTLYQVAEYIGLSKRHVVALVAAGIIEATHGPLVDNQSTWEFDVRDIDTAMKRLLEHIPVQLPTRNRNSNKITDFQRGQRSMTLYNLGLPRLILDIYQGILPAFRAIDELRFDILWFHTIDFSQYQSDYRNTCSGSLSVNTVCERLNCKPTTLRRLYATGLLVPITDQTDTLTIRHLYAENDIAIFLANYIDSRQAAELLSISQITIQSWVRIGRLVAVTGPDIDGSHAYRFDRASLVQWRFERLTFGEAMKVLHISKATLHRWVASGKLHHIDDMGGKQRWFWKKDILELVNK